MNNRQKKSEAFTVIELWVVIAIIAVLMGILMPVLNAAKKQARSLYCVSNHKTLCLAWLMYKDENDDKLVWGNSDNAGTRGWVRIPVTSYSTEPLEQEKKGIRQGELFPYVKAMDAYRCPGDMRQLEADTPSFRTYSIAGGMNGMDPDDGTGNWEILAHLKYSTINNPATKIVFIAEPDPRGVNQGSWVMRPSTRQWVDPFAIWHTKNRSTLGYADGHGEVQRWQSKDLVEWCNSVWDPPWQGFYRTPADEEEWMDFDEMVKKYAYRRLSP